MRILLFAVTALLTLPATSASARPPLMGELVSQGFTHLDAEGERQAYARRIAAPPGGLPRAEMVFDMDDISMRGVEEFDCGGSRRRLLWAIQYPQPGLRGEGVRVGEQQNWVPVAPESFDGDAMRIACGS